MPLRHLAPLFQRTEIKPDPTMTANSFNIVRQVRLSHAVVRADARDAVLQGLPVRLERGRALSQMERATHTDALARHLESIERAPERAVARVMVGQVTVLTKHNGSVAKAKDALNGLATQIIAQAEAEIGQTVETLNELVPALGFKAMQSGLDATKGRLRAGEETARQQRQGTDMDALIMQARRETSLRSTLLRRHTVKISGRRGVVQFLQLVVREGVCWRSRHLLEQAFDQLLGVDGAVSGPDAGVALPEALRFPLQNAALSSEQALEAALRAETRALVQHRVAMAIREGKLTPTTGVASKVSMRAGVTVKGRFADALAALVGDYLHLRTGELEPITTDEDSVVVTVVYVVRALDEVFAFDDLMARVTKVSQDAEDRALYARRAHEMYRPALRFNGSLMDADRAALTAVKAMLTPNLAEVSRARGRALLKLRSGPRSFGSLDELARLPLTEELDVHRRFFDAFCDDRAAMSRSVQNMNAGAAPKRTADRAAAFARVVGARA